MKNIGRLPLILVLLTAQVAAANTHLLHHLCESLVASDDCSCEDAGPVSIVNYRHTHEQPASERDCRDCVVCEATEDLVTLAPVPSPPNPVALTAMAIDCHGVSAAFEPTIGPGLLGGAPPSLLHAITLPLLN